MCNRGAIFDHCGDFNQMQEAFFWTNNWRGDYNRARCNKWGMDAFRDSPYYGNGFCAPRQQSSYAEAWTPQNGATGPGPCDNVAVQQQRRQTPVPDAMACPCATPGNTNSALANANKFITSACGTMGGINGWIFLLMAFVLGIIIGCLIKR